VISLVTLIAIFWFLLAAALTAHVSGHELVAVRVAAVQALYMVP